MMNLTRKLAPAFAVVAAVSLLAGCAAQGTGKDKVDTENESTSQNAKSPENQSSTSAVKERMRIVETDKGEVEIPENPRTIVCFRNCHDQIRFLGCYHFQGSLRTGNVHLLDPIHFIRQKRI